VMTGLQQQHGSGSDVPRATGHILPHRRRRGPGVLSAVVPTIVPAVQPAVAAAGDIR
jgi:hypothetical protein